MPGRSNSTEDMVVDVRDGCVPVGPVGSVHTAAVARVLRPLRVKCLVPERARWVSIGDEGGRSRR